MRVAAAVALIQVSLGITTLLLGVPLGIAMAHQLGAVGLLTVLLLAGRRSERCPNIGVAAIGEQKEASSKRLAISRERTCERAASSGKRPADR
jgi:hypothetical protein